MSQSDPIVEKISVTLADGVEREMNFRADQITWLRRERGLDLPRAVTLIKVVPDLTSKEQGKSRIDSSALDAFIASNLLDLAFASFRYGGHAPIDLHPEHLAEASFEELQMLQAAVIKTIIRDMLTPAKKPATVPNSPVPGPLTN